MLEATIVSYTLLSVSHIARVGFAIFCDIFQEK